MTTLSPRPQVLTRVQARPPSSYHTRSTTVSGSVRRPETRTQVESSSLQYPNPRPDVLRHIREHDPYRRTGPRVRSGPTTPFSHTGTTVVIKSSHVHVCVRQSTLLHSKRVCTRSFQHPQSIPVHTVVSPYPSDSISISRLSD